MTHADRGMDTKTGDLGFVTATSEEKKRKKVSNYEYPVILVKPVNRVKPVTEVKPVSPVRLVNGVEPDGHEKPVKKDKLVRNKPVKEVKAIY